MLIRSNRLTTIASECAADRLAVIHLALEQIELSIAKTGWNHTYDHPGVRLNGSNALHETVMAKPNAVIATANYSLQHEHLLRIAEISNSEFVKIDSRCH